MNLRVEAYLYVDEENWVPDEFARISMAFSDVVTALGYGNVSEEPGEQKVCSVVIVRPFPDGLNFEEAVRGAATVTLPTGDMEFLREAEKGGIAGL